MITVLNKQTRHPVRTKRIRLLLERLVRRYRLRNTEVCLTLVGRERIRSLNRTYRRKDAVTDVLSFPLAGRQPDGIRHLGDIVIAPEVSRQKSRKLGRSLDEEIEILTVHGFLHLLGFRHSAAMDREERRPLGLDRTPKKP